MNYADPVTSVRLELTTQKARKESDGEVRLRLVGARWRWQVTDRWVGDSGVPAAEWIGKGTRWYKDGPPQFWRNDLDGLSLTVADLVGGHLGVDFNNDDDADDSWGFDLRLVALTAHGEVSLVDPLGHPTVLSSPHRVGNVGSKLFYFKVPPPPPPPQPPDVTALVDDLIRRGRCEEAEHVANQMMQQVAVAFCYAQHEDHANAARFAEALSVRLPVTDVFSASFKLLMRDLASEQAALLKIRQRAWQITRFAVDLPADFKSALAQLIDVLRMQWEAHILTHRNTRCFGPMRLDAKEPVIAFMHSPATLGAVTVLTNRTVMTLQLAWDAYDFVKRFRKDDEYSNGRIQVKQSVVVAAKDTELLVDVAATGIGDIDMSTESWNPEFSAIVFGQSLIALATAAAITPNLSLISLSLRKIIAGALPWLPAELGWAVVSLELRKDDCIVGVGFGPG